MLCQDWLARGDWGCNSRRRGSKSRLIGWNDEIACIVMLRPRNGDHFGRLKLAAVHLCVVLNDGWACVGCGGQLSTTAVESLNVTYLKVWMQIMLVATPPPPPVLAVLAMKC